MVTALAGQVRLLTSARTDLSGHLASHGPLPPVERFVGEVAQAGLTGRGGAGFPAARKLLAVLAEPGPAIVVGNAAEGEPASAKDRWLLHANPHLVLDGLQLAAAATRAAEVYRTPYPTRTCTAACGGPARAVTGGHRPAPGPTRVGRGQVRRRTGDRRPPAHRRRAAVAHTRALRIATHGLRGRPTLLHNVESLAHLALIGRYGAAWFRSAGTVDEPGTMLTTVWPCDGPGRVGEHERGTPLAAVLGPEAGAAVLISGYHGCWLPAGRARTLRLSDADLRPHGATVGAGVLAELPPDRCGLRETARVMRYLSAESAGQCRPCRNGLPRIAGAFTALGDGTAGPAAVADILRWSELVVGRGACAHPDGSMRLVRSALAVFEPETRVHLAGGCTARSSAPFLPLPAPAFQASR
ncbi:MAG: NADH-ubiquinone oxidoreductase-F iron-sulfur binding region domain-containing protein [Geodermatophilaceae bacterium]